MTNFNYARLVDKWVGLALCLVFWAWERTVGPLVGRRRIAGLLATTPPRADDPVPPPRRILAIKFYGLGNMVMLLPVLAAVRARHPGVEIDFLTLAPNRTLLERSGLFARTIGVDTSRFGTFLGTMRQAVGVVRARRYDTILDFEQFVKVSTVFAFLSGARERIGFNTDGQRRGFMYTRRVVYTDSDHMTAIFARLVRPIGITGPLPSPALAVTPAEHARVSSVLDEAGVRPDHFPVIGIHVGSGDNFYRMPLKRWDVANFAAVADALADRFDARVVLTGRGPEERALVDAMHAGMRARAVDTCDALSVMELAALLERCHLVVSNDTSVMHLAALVGTPVVALFGPTAPLHYGPRGERHLVFYRDLFCSPCLTNYNLKVSRCLDPVCMRDIRPEEVVAAIARQYLGDGAEHRAFVRARTNHAPAA